MSLSMPAALAKRLAHEAKLTHSRMRRRAITRQRPVTPTETRDNVALQKRLDRVMASPLVLLAQPGPRSFVVADQRDPHHTYRVLLGRQTCSCSIKMKKATATSHSRIRYDDEVFGHCCDHLLFVMARVLKVSRSDPRLVARRLRNYEVQSLLSGYRVARHAATLRRVRVSTGGDGANLPECPICLASIRGGEATVSCETGCKQRMHLACMRVWAEALRRRRERVCCPLCRCDWRGGVTQSSCINSTASTTTISTSTTTTTTTTTKTTTHTATTTSTTDDNTVVTSTNDTHSVGTNTNSPRVPASGSAPTSANFISSSSSSSPSAGRRGALCETTQGVTVGAIAKLPDSPALPAEQLRRLRSWVNIFSERTISCLFALEWTTRYWALKHVAKTLQQAEARHRDANVLAATGGVLAHAARDPVFKVYDAALSVLSVLRAGDDRGIGLRTPLAPVLEIVLTKCGDAGRRVREKSVACIIEALVHGTIDWVYLLRLVLSRTCAPLTSVYSDVSVTISGSEGTSGGSSSSQPRDRTMAPWRWWLGRLVILDRLLTLYTDRFLHESCAHFHGSGGGKGVTEFPNDPLAVAKTWCAPALEHTHQRVKQTAQALRQRLTELSTAARCFVPSTTSLQQSSDDFVSGGCEIDCATALSLVGTGADECTPTAPTAPLNAGGCSNNTTDLDSIFLAQAVEQSLQTAVTQDLSPASAAATITATAGMTLVGGGGQMPCCVCTHNTCLNPHDILRTSPFASLRLLTDNDVTDASSSRVLYPPPPPLLTCGDGQAEYREGQYWLKGPLLGTGATGSVYLARDIATKRRFVVKQVPFVRNTHKAEQRVLRTVMRELDVLCRLEPHPNLVAYYGARVDGHHINIFLQHVPDGSLSTVMVRNGCAPPYQTVRRYARQIVRALAHLHAQGVLHRDLKAANVLLDASAGNSGSVRLCDFGAAARLETAAATQSGEFRSTHGTPAFMAPEVIRGESYGRAADIWSLGCLLIELGSGRPPWSEVRCENPYALLFRIASSTDLPKMPESLGEEGRRFVLRCLVRNPADRASAKELLEDVWLKEDPPPSPLAPPSTFEASARYNKLTHRTTSLAEFVRHAASAVNNC